MASLSKYEKGGILDQVQMAALPEGEGDGEESDGAPMF